MEVKVRCPKCNSVMLHEEVRAIAKCTYCGHKFFYDRKRRIFPIATLSLVIVNLVVFLLFGFDLSPRTAGKYGLIPSDVLRGLNSWTLVMHMFIHKNVWHIFFNMLILMSFGYLLEKRVGTVKFLAIYFLGGIFSGFMHAVVYPDSFIPLVGSSGAIFAIIGTVAFLDPTLTVYIFFVIPVPIILFISLYFFIATYLIEIGVTFGIGHVAHIWGMILGAVAALSINYKNALKGAGYSFLTFAVLIMIIILVPNLIPSITQLIKQPKISYSWDISTIGSNSTHTGYYIRTSVTNQGYDTAKNVVILASIDSQDKGVILGEDESIPYDIEPGYLFIIPSVVFVKNNVTARAHLIIEGDNIPIKESYSNWFQT